MSPSLSFFFFRNETLFLLVINERCCCIRRFPDFRELTLTRNPLTDPSLLSFDVLLFLSQPPSLLGVRCRPYHRVTDALWLIIYGNDNIQRRHSRNNKTKFLTHSNRAGVACLF